MKQAAAQTKSAQDEAAQIIAQRDAAQRKARQEQEEREAKERLARHQRLMREMETKKKAEEEAARREEKLKQREEERARELTQSILNPKPKSKEPTGASSNKAVRKLQGESDNSRVSLLLYICTRSCTPILTQTHTLTGQSLHHLAQGCMGPTNPPLVEPRGVSLQIQHIENRWLLQKRRLPPAQLNDQEVWKSAFHANLPHVLTCAFIRCFSKSFEECLNSKTWRYLLIGASSNHR